MIKLIKIIIKLIKKNNDKTNFKKIKIIIKLIKKKIIELIKKTINGAMT